MRQIAANVPFLQMHGVDARILTPNDMWPFLRCNADDEPTAEFTERVKGGVYVKDAGVVNPADLAMRYAQLARADGAGAFTYARFCLSSFTHICDKHLLLLSFPFFFRFLSYKRCASTRASLASTPRRTSAAC
jgi:hypothetical protein